MHGLWAVLLLAGCAEATAPINDLRVTASVEPAVLGAGEVANVTITVTNLGTRSRTVSPYNCPPPFVVTTLAGIAVGPHQPLCILILLAPKVLAPSEQFVYRQRWNGNSYNGDQSYLPPGGYWLRPKVQSAYGLVPTDPVSVTIMP